MDNRAFGLQGPPPPTVSRGGFGGIPGGSSSGTSAPSRGPRPQPGPAPGAEREGLRVDGVVDPPQQSRRGQPAAGGVRRGASQERRNLTSPGWDHADWLRRLHDAKRAGDEKAERQLLREVAKSNYQLQQGPFSKDVPRTDLVSRAEAKQRVSGTGKDPIFSISGMMTGDALMHFAGTNPRAGVCALNFANGETVGGGYLNGARAQEEELCRQFPSLYTSLTRAKEYGRAYPFGPPTYKAGGDAARYADVLWTPFLVARRGSKEAGYRLLADHEVLDNMCMVTAAAPNLKHGEVWDPRLMLEAIRNIFVVPKIRHKDPGKIDTLILGAWGCGAFGCDPREMATVFAKVLLEDRLGRLYKEVHFAIPAGSDRNAEVFEATLLECGVPLARLGGGAPSAAAAGPVTACPVPTGYRAMPAGQQRPEPSRGGPQAPTGTQRPAGNRR